MMRTAPAVTPVAIPATALFEVCWKFAGGALVDVELGVEEVLLLLLLLAGCALVVNVVELDVIVDDVEVEVGTEEVEDELGIVDVTCSLDVGLDVGLDVDKALVSVALNCDSSDESTLLGIADSSTSSAFVASAEAVGPWVMAVEEAPDRVATSPTAETRSSTPLPEFAASSMTEVVRMLASVKALFVSSLLFDICLRSSEPAP